jgi:hypothetical protein
MGAAAAFSLVPRTAEAAWAAIAAAPHAARRSLSQQQAATVGAVADTIIPRTDTPGATDIGIQAFVDVIVTENYTGDERAAFLSGLEAINGYAKSLDATKPAFVDMGAGSDRHGALQDIERLADRRSEPARTYWRLKGLVIHGYFTSERVMKDVLNVEIRPGRFDGAASMPARGGGSHA